MITSSLGRAHNWLGHESTFGAEKDFNEFVDVRKNELIRGIENIIIKNEVKIETPKADAIRAELGSLERKLRLLVNNKLTEISKEPYKDFINDKLKEEIDRKIFSEMKKSPHLTFSDFESFEKKLEKLTFGELVNIIFSKKGWNAFEIIFKDKNQLIKRVDQLIPFRNKFAHNNDASIVELHDAKASLDWFSLIIE